MSYPSSIVSLAPSATSTLREMDALDRVSGVTTHCDYDNAPTVGGWLNPDYDKLTSIDPDLILTSDALQTDIRDQLRNNGYTVSHTAPQTLQQVIDSFIHIGDAIGRREAAESVAWDFQTQLSHIHRRVKEEPHPTIYCEEWSNPPMVAGNWIPDIVRIAGGEYPFVEPGERSQEIPRETIENERPDHVFLHICGFGTSTSPETVTNRKWAIPAIESSQVHVMDDSLLNQPSPTLIDGITQMAQILHPDVSLG